MAGLSSVGNISRALKFSPIEAVKASLRDSLKEAFTP
jgi:hypothetical protein